MKAVLFFSICLFWIKATNGQATFAVIQGATSAFYSNIDSALINASPGATIYLPSGIFTISGEVANLTQELHLVGVGYNPDSTVATGITRITNDLSFFGGSDNSSVIGIDIGSIYIDINVQNIFINRCQIASVTLTGGASSNNKIVLSECIVLNTVTTTTGFAANSTMNATNTIFQSQVNNMSDSQFVNCIFLYSSATMYVLATELNSIFNNCIFLTSTQYINGCVGCNNEFTNNLFVNAEPLFNGDLDLNNIKGVLTSNIFVDQLSNTYNYKHDYHLKPSCPGINAGTDGTDVGIFGSITPFKVGGLPVNPHISLKQIGTVTDQNGNLPVNIKVVAQDH